MLFPVAIFPFFFLARAWASADCAEGYILDSEYNFSVSVTHRTGMKMVVNINGDQDTSVTVKSKEFKVTPYGKRRLP